MREVVGPINLAVEGGGQKRRSRIPRSAFRWYARLAMTRRPTACLAILGVATMGLWSAPALAQQAPAPVAAAAPPVRVHLGTYRNKGTARLYIQRTDGSYTFVCASPCTADMAAHSELRVTLGSNEDEPHTFEVPADLGSEIDVQVRPASAGPLVGSIVLMGSGGALILSGAIMVALSDIRLSTASGRSVTDSYKTIGLVMMGVGAATAVGGLVWLLTRSHEPKVEGAPHRDRAPDVYGRGETLLGDVAAQKARDAASTLPTPATPLELRFTF